MTTARAPLHGFIRKTSHDGWHDFAAEHGCSVSSLLDVLGDLLDEMPSSLPDWLDEIVRDARRTDAANRRRKRNGATR